MAQEHDDIPFEIDHIIAESHGGPTAAQNLALACYHCNSFKGANLAGIDPQRQQHVPRRAPSNSVPAAGEHSAFKQ
jgi:5-methylcytosine-specific restriction endonuclease McrA